jgi:hypothetical protein
MTISDPTKPWAIVLCALEGSSPSPQIGVDFANMFRFGFGGVADFWRDQSLGAIDVSASEPFGWFPCGWTVLDTPGITPYPGITSGGDRGVAAQQARAVLTANNPGLDLGRFRGVLSVFNFPVNGGNMGADVVCGINAVGCPLSWAERGWYRCLKCTALTKSSTAGLACFVGPGTSHALDAREYLVPADSNPTVAWSCLIDVGLLGSGAPPR